MSYRVNFAERQGNCGPIAETVTAPTNTGGPPDPNCTDRTTVSADQCTVAVDRTCRVATGEDVTFRGPVHWNKDGSIGTGTVQEVVVRGGAAVCTSTYDVSYTKL